jgi:hypothetical protein
MSITLRFSRGAPIMSITLRFSRGAPIMSITLRFSRGAPIMSITLRFSRGAPITRKVFYLKYFPIQRYKFISIGNEITSQQSTILGKKRRI